MRNTLENRTRRYKGGVTLVELLIYIMLSAIIMTMVLNFSRKNTVDSVRNLRRMQTTKDVNEISEYVGEDLRRMGAKAGQSRINDQDYVLNVSPNVYYDDSASFEDFVNNDSLDSIRFRFAEFDDTGAVERWAEVKYFVDDEDFLWRVYYPSGAADSVDSVKMAPNVTKFNISFGTYTFEGDPDAILYEVEGRLSSDHLKMKPGDDDPDFSEKELTYNVGNFEWSDFEPDSLHVLRLTDSTDETIREVDTVLAGNTYGIEFDFEPKGSLDHTTFNIDSSYMAVVVRKDGTDDAVAGVKDFLFYPGVNVEIHDKDQLGEAFRFIEFTPAEDAEVNLEFRFAFDDQDVDANTSFILSRLKFYRISDDRFTFADTVGEANKRKVKALKLTVAVDSKEAEALGSTVADSIVKIIPVPNNGI